jgi:hypothetical protein
MWNFARKASIQKACSNMPCVLQPIITVREVFRNLPELINLSWAPEISREVFVMFVPPSLPPVPLLT